MANLSFSDKQLIESVFDMSSGYVINFSNREFEEFMKDVVQYNIYAKYPGLSKAKMFREFLKDESDTLVGKAIILLINHMKDANLITIDKNEKTEKLYELGKRLLGKSNSKPDNKKEVKNTSESLNIDYDGFNTSLLDLEKISNSQIRGYEFEKYLNTLFKAFGLDPHASYRTEFDQIDGSFVLDKNTILIEAKYRKNSIPKDDLILFSRKIKLKSHFARGLFITYSLLDNKAVDYFTDRSSRFVVLTVEELFIMCQNKTPLIDVLHKKFRLLDERGLIYKHVMNL
ncbi:MAG TPA: restriction endonuclease [Ohtaekwangia sp.]|nr:restriction endonuclease [Ohtaekwangia sp.]